MMDLSLEKNIFSQGYRTVMAFDEVGRGPLAGPVLAACVVIEPAQKISNLLLEKVIDSKRLSEVKREELYEEINKEFENVGIGECGHDTIDRINILQASFLAMKKAMGACKINPDFLLVDGKFVIPNLSITQRAVINGDSLVFSIAAASIIAKVVRDRIMRAMNDYYPFYGFDQHKGYGTKIHMEALEKLGPCKIHRKSFRPVKRYIESN